MNDALAGKKALVTGGTRGIGLAVGQDLRAHGAEVVLVARKAEPVDGFRTAVCDVRDRAQLEALRDSLDSLDILVANAGMNKRAEAIDLQDADLREIIDTNFYGAFVTCQVFGPLLLRQPGGRCIVTSSIAGVHGQKLRAAYSAAKAALDGMVRALAVEWGPLGCTVNAIAPGFIKTSMAQPYRDANPDRVAAVIAHTPLRRLGEPEEVASVVTFLASDAARFITGQVIYIDGGVTAGSDWW
jgi:NAD(P)-dependent dehydrogenase (short-subunit alcohol dehydrogenase family)